MGTHHRNRNQQSAPSGEEKHRTRPRRPTNPGLAQDLEPHLNRGDQNLHGVRSSRILPEAMEDRPDRSVEETGKARLLVTGSLPTHFAPQHAREATRGGHGKTFILLRGGVRTAP